MPFGKRADLLRAALLVYDKAKGALYYDADGSGAAAQVQFATLIKKDKLTYSDFFVI